MGEEKPVISLLCALRNDERFIRETLDTVVSQTYPHWELIVMDGMSTDRTAAIVGEYAAKYKNIILHTEPDEGQWHALEKAFKLAKGKYIMQLCGQDGYLDNDWFKRCVETFDAHPEVSLVWGIPFNMSEDGKLVGPHYAYAAFLRDDRYGSRTKPLGTLVAKVDFKRPAAMQRLKKMAKKLTWSRLKLLIRSFQKKDIPQKEDWFFYWLETERAFPEGNMCIRREAYEKNTVRFPKETKNNVVLMDFCYDFNARGYLAYGLPVAASFGRTHATGQPLLAYDVIANAKYRQQIADLRERLKTQKTFTFIDASGNVYSERKLH